MSENAVISARQRLVANLTETLPLNEMAHQLCFFLMDAVPSDRMLWYALAPGADSAEALIDYARGTHARSASPGISQLLRSRVIRSLCHPKYKDILLCPRATAVPQVYRFMRIPSAAYTTPSCVCIFPQQGKEKLPMQYSGCRLIRTITPRKA